MVKQRRIKNHPISVFTYSTYVLSGLLPLSVHYFITTTPYPYSVINRKFFVFHLVPSSLIISHCSLSPSVFGFSLFSLPSRKIPPSGFLSVPWWCPLVLPSCQDNGITSLYCLLASGLLSGARAGPGAASQSESALGQLHVRSCQGYARHVGARMRRGMKWRRRRHSERQKLQSEREEKRGVV